MHLHMLFILCYTGMVAANIVQSYSNIISTVHTLGASDTHTYSTYDTLVKSCP